MFIGNEVNLSGDCLDMRMAIYQGVIEKFACKAAWQKALAKYNLQGYNMRIDGDDNELAKAYGVRGVPYFFILDKEGRFASETTPRLSSEEKLIKLIEGLL